MGPSESSLGLRTLGRKYIKGFAGGIAQQYACSAQHYAWLAYRLMIPIVTIDLLALRIEPAEFDIERNRILAGMCQATLLRNIRQLAWPGTVVSAVLSARFGLDESLEGGCPDFLGRAVVTVILTDDRGKQWRVDHVEERMLIQR